ncbi:hypothetical protein BJX99DRAFT_229983, partial [Aspergillus californicus]
MRDRYVHEDQFLTCMHSGYHASLASFILSIILFFRWLFERYLRKCWLWGFPLGWYISGAYA